MISLKSCILAAIVLEVANGFSPSSPSRKAFVTSPQTTQLDASRSDFLRIVATTGALSLTTQISTVFPALADGATTTSPSGVVIEVLKTGDGPKPEVGQLAGIRFKAIVKETGNKIDDVFDTPEPYYTRVGSGGLIKVKLLVLFAITKNFAHTTVVKFIFPTS
uniref:Peptidylprolyl isomerase n=1 Tax=Corethron hystrix TaxID=216773 RepID=A0A7S1C0A8_9STRA|mmetsp:Transcript_636/g.1259  ORF Transcript_636/g.1259 Transcript_636/m.1259 type:complete len:163 (+) Transcript_636:94-582(+)